MRVFGYQTWETWVFRAFVSGFILGGAGGGNPAYLDISLLFPKGHPLRFCLALGLQHRLPARHLAPVRHQHLARAKGPASRALQVLDHCRRRCFQLVLSLLLLPSARWQAALSPHCLDSKRPNSRVLAPVPPALVSANQPLPFWSHRLYFCLTSSWSAPSVTWRKKTFCLAYIFKNYPP